MGGHGGGMPLVASRMMALLSHQPPSQFEAPMDKATLSPSIVAAGLETRRLSRTVLDKSLVSDISVAVPPGEILAVVGPSGAGKSSFLRLLNRLDEPTSGTVRLNGQDYREMPAQDLRRRVGMVMQSAYLFPAVATNVGFGPQ